MLTQIEDAAITRLLTKGVQVKKTAIKKGVEGIVQPAIHVAIEGGTFTKISTFVYKAKVRLFFYLIVKSLKDEKERRIKMSPIIQSVIDVFMLQKLGLNIEPLSPVGFDNYTNDVIRKQGMLAYQIEFSTSYNFTKTDDDEESADLLSTIEITLDNQGEQQMTEVTNV